MNVWGFANLHYPGDSIASRLRLLLARLVSRRISRIPEHVAIIPDGNRRWARRRGLPAWVGHYVGYQVMRRVLNRLWELGVKSITVYALSRENCTRRSREELEKLYKLLSLAFQELRRDKRVQEGSVGVRIVGDLALLPEWLVREADELTSISNSSARHILTICTCYSGRWEIVKAVGELVEQGLEVSEENLAKLMLIDSPPDLLIRTGGELRLSNFLLWHIAYTELYFTKRLWPDFDELELVRALVSFSKRERRFGA